MPSPIIIIENDLAMQQSFAKNLNDANWELLIYNYADANLPALSLMHPALIILDFKSSSADFAWGFLQMLKMDDATAEIPILITTSLDPLAAEIRAYLALQYIQIIYTPIDFEQLIKVIKQILNLENPHPSSPFSARTLPILVVEDNEELREALSEILSLEGYQVVTAENGLLALEAVYKAEHSLIFLDIQMPIMNGFEFLEIYGRQVREHRPIVILSADSTLISQQFPTFVVDLLSKPYDVDNLLLLAAKYSIAV